MVITWDWEAQAHMRRAPARSGAPRPSASTPIRPTLEMGPPGAVIEYRVTQI